jgi:CzcA family heavy metal efflux pump
MSESAKLSSIKKFTRSGGLAAWSIKHPVGVSMIALAVVVLGVFALGRLAIDLLPHLIYPEIRVRIIDSGVPAKVMEDRVTRQLEEQLAITEDAVSVQSTTGLGLSTVNLSFAYGKDIDIALRDASTRLDRAKRFLPESIDPPIIYKLDPSQIPIAEYVVSSSLRDPIELRSWVDNVFSKWFLTLPGVAAVEVGGGLVREIHIQPDQQRLAGVGLTFQDLIDALKKGNREDPTGRLQMQKQQIAGRISGRFNSVEEIRGLPLSLPNGNTIYLNEIAEVIDTHEDERIRVRGNGVPGVKVSLQKQPTANTVAVVDVVKERMQWLRQQGILPEDIELTTVGDQSIYIRQSLRNSALAAISGGILAMIVVYIFLGNLRRTLIIGSAIPIAIMVTFVLMGIGGLTLNVMTLGGLALGVGMLVDNTIVMLENIYRHQQQGESAEEAGIAAAQEVNSAIVAATSTNLAAILPFLFVGGLIGLLFRELIFTISAAIVASLVLAVTLVPALAARIKDTGTNVMRRTIDRFILGLQNLYARVVQFNLRVFWLAPLVFIIGLYLAAPTFFTGKQEFLPKLDDGLISMTVLADPGVSLDEMDASARKLENLFLQQQETLTVFTLAGGSIFGRTEREIANRTTFKVQLVPLSQRNISSQEWIRKMTRAIDDMQLAGIRVSMRQRGIRGIRTSRGDDDISLRVQGPQVETLEEIATALTAELKNIKGLRNIESSSEEQHFELSIEIDRERATTLGLAVEDVSTAMQIALDGKVISDFIDGDRAYDIRLRLPQSDTATPQDLDAILLFSGTHERPPVYLGDVADVVLVEAPANIKRDNQMRIVEISASLTEDATIGGILQHIDQVLADFQMPTGYTVYEGGAKETLQEGKNLTITLLALALFLVLVVMAVQYESLRNPFIIMIGVPFAAIGVAIGISVHELTLSMPVWLGMIMLAGIVVNNAIVLVEYIEILRERGSTVNEAIINAAKLRLRPILMTTLTTVVGMLPLALGIGEGAEMLQPLAVTIVWGLSFSMLVSLLLIPLIYKFFHLREIREEAGLSHQVQLP